MPRTPFQAAVELALMDPRDLSPADAAQTAYRPHGIPITNGLGTTVVHLQQTFAGVPILDAVRSVRIRDGAEARVTGRPVALGSAGAPKATIPARQAAYVACLRVAEHAEVEVSNRRPTEGATFAQPDRPTVLRKRGFYDPIRARLLWVPVDGQLRLVWEVRLELEVESRPWEVLVSATGAGPEILRVRSLAAHGVSGPVHNLSPPTATPAQLDFPRDRWDYPDFEGAPLPPGDWLTAQSTEGNNAVVVDDDGGTLAAQVDAAGNAVFRPGDPFGPEQAQVNAFYLCNFLHDFFHLLGFDEAKGNFQRTNQSGVGGGDPVRVFVYTRPKPQIAYFLNRLDGRAPELVLRPGANGRHAGLDADVVIHEYVHGVTDRLVGRSETERPFAAPQSIALAEGFSDYFALTIQNYYRRRVDAPPDDAQPDDAQPADPQPADPQSWVFGAWVSGEPTGLRAASYGPRFAPTYGTLKDPGFSRDHDAGQVWCQTLIEMNQALGEGDADVGDERGWQVVFDALCCLHQGTDGPHFLHARDAIYDALEDRVASWGTDTDSVIRAVRGVFATRGMGAAAKSNSAGYRKIEESFQEQ